MQRRVFRRFVFTSPTSFPFCRRPYKTRYFKLAAERLLLLSDIEETSRGNRMEPKIRIYKSTYYSTARPSSSFAVTSYTLVGRQCRGAYFAH